MTTTEPTLEASTRIRRARGAMPYGALVHVNFPPRQWASDPDPLTLEDVATYLEALQAVLERVSKDHQAEQEELRTLRATIAGGRTLLLALLPELTPCPLLDSEPPA